MQPPAKAWLEALCEVLPGASVACVVSDSGAIVASWPDASPPADLSELAHESVRRRKPLARADGDAPGAGLKQWRIAVPLDAGGALAALLSWSEADDAEDLVALLRCAAAGRGAGDEEVARVAALALGHERFADAALAVATDVAATIGCERVSIGFSRRGRMHVEAISHSARFRDDAALVRDLAAAMDEAADQDSALLHPTSEDAPLRVTRAHASLASRHGAGVVCTIPLVRCRRAVGAMTFEWPEGHAPDAARFAQCRRVAALLGPVLALEREVDRRLFERGREQLRTWTGRLVGPGHLGLKACASAFVLGLAVLALAPGTHRVAARATLEGRVQRAVVAGFDGFISESHARAGDLVRRGQVMGRLDARDLSLEKRKLAGRVEQLRREYREAFAGLDRTQISIISAKKSQAEAQLALVDEKLARTQLVAPFDGVVVEGDLTQSLGSPVTKGDLLFQVAPLDGYRIMLAVDERDIAEVGVGQRGELALAALPGRTLPLSVERLTPVATHDTGRTTFRVEARLERQLDALRPGMEGIAKIEVGRRRLLWIWTHDLADWLRLQAWSWWP